MKNCYDKAMELIRLAEEISDLCDKLGKAVKPTERAIYEQKINIAEDNLFRIKNRLKNTEYTD